MMSAFPARPLIGDTRETRMNLRPVGSTNLDHRPHSTLDAILAALSPV